MSFKEQNFMNFVPLNICNRVFRIEYFLPFKQLLF